MASTPLHAVNAFIAVARHRRYAAARDLGVSTSALSQPGRRLETRLGITLLSRTSRSVALTDPGLRLLDSAGPAVDQALESLKTVKATLGKITGRVRPTVPTVAVTLILAGLLPRLLGRYPRAHRRRGYLTSHTAAGLAIVIWIAPAQELATRKGGFQILGALALLSAMPEAACFPYTPVVSRALARSLPPAEAMPSPALLMRSRALLTSS